MLLDPESVI